MLKWFLNWLITECIITRSSTNKQVSITKNMIHKKPMPVESFLLLICCHNFFPSVPYIIHFTPSPSWFVYEEDIIFVLIIDLDQKKQTELKLPVGIMKSRQDNIFCTPLHSLFLFSFSVWHLLIQESWLPIPCFQSHLILAAGDLTRGMFFGECKEKVGQSDKKGWN